MVENDHRYELPTLRPERASYPDFSNPPRYSGGNESGDSDGEEKQAKVGGYHCWAYVWIEGQGWMPVDISEADKHPEKTDFFFGTLDADRVTMTGGRDLELEPAPAEGTLNFFIYPYAEVDGKKLDKVTRAFKRINP